MIPKKDDLQNCSNYRILSLIPHLNKIILLIILSRLLPQSDKILSEEQAGFRKLRNDIE